MKRRIDIQNEIFFHGIQSSAYRMSQMEIDTYRQHIEIAKQWITGPQGAAIPEDLKPQARLGNLQLQQALAKMEGYRRYLRYGELYPEDN